ACDDGDPNTYDDVVTAEYECAGHVVMPGEICNLPIDVTSLPYSHSGNTATYLNDYISSDVPPLADGAITNGTGSTSYLSGTEVVYGYTPTQNEILTISTTNAYDWVSLWVFIGCPFASTL